MLRIVLVGIAFIMLELAWAGSAEAASRYLVATGNWDSTGSWAASSGGASGASVPGASDDVILDATSGSANLTINVASACRSLDATGFTGTLTHNAAMTLSIGDSTAGSGNNALIFPSSGWTYTLGSTITSAISFISTSTTVQNVNFNGKTAGNVTFDGVGGSWKLTGTLTANAVVTTLKLTNGTLDTNGQTLNIGKFYSSNVNTRTLTLGSSTVNVQQYNDSWNIQSSTNLTFNPNTSTIALNSTQSGLTFYGGGITYNNVTFSSGGDTISGANTFANLTFTGTASKTNIYSFSANQTITGTLTINGNSATNRILVASDTVGTARTLTAATVTVTNADFRDITGAGAGSWDLSAVTGNCGDAGGNSGITFTTAATQYWQTTTTGSKTWSTAGNWFLATNGGGGAGRVPLPQDNVIFDANSIGATSTTVTADMARLGKSIDWTGVTNSPTFAISSLANTIYGSLTLVSGMTLTTGQTPVFEGRGSFTFTSAGKTFGSITMQMSGGTLTLQDDLTLGSNNTFTLNNGTFDANGKNFTAGIFSSSNSNTRTITMGTGTWTLTGNNGTIWTTATDTNLTINLGNAIVSNYSGSTGTRTINAAATESKAPSFNITAGTDTVNVTTAAGNLDFTGFAGTLGNNGRSIYGNLTIASGMTLTAGGNVTTFAATSGTKTITSNGKTLDFPITFNGVGGTWQLADNLTVGSTRTVTLTKGTLDANNKDFSMGFFSSINSNTRTLTMGTGTWSLTSTGTVWDTSTTTNLTFTSTTATIKTTDSSSTSKEIAAGSLSGFPSIWISAGSGATGIAFTSVTNCLDLNFTGYTGTGPVFPNTINGSLTLVSGMTMPAGSATAITFAATSGTKTITSAGQIIDRPLTFDGVGGTWQLADALDIATTSNRTLTLTNGTLDANNKNVSMGLFSSSNSNTRVITMGSGTWTLASTGTVWTTATTTGLTLNANTSTISITNTSSSAKTFAGGGITFNNLSITGSGTGAVTISGSNTFNTFTINPPKTVTFTINTTQTVTTFSATGTSGNVITINSSTGGTAATLSKSSGTVTCDYLSLQDSAATGGAVWLPGSNSTNLGGNTGWVFPGGGALEIGGD